jgi:hypothetical protein
MTYLYVGLACFVAGALAEHFLEVKIRNAIGLKLDALHIKVDAIGAALKK